MENNRVDWTSKGLGWIPDLPTIVETNIEKELSKPKRIAPLDPVDQLTAKFFDLISILEKTSPLKTEIQSLRRDLENFSDNINFFTSCYHKVLRRDQSNPAKEVLRLRKAFLELVISSQKNDYINLRKEFQKILSSQGGTSEEADKDVFDWISNDKTTGNLEIDFKKIQKVLDWLNNDQFDGSLELIVKSFQHDKKLLNNNFVNDGIVGLKTLTAIQEGLQLEPQTASEVTTYNNESIIFLPVPLIIPDEVLGIAFEYLKLSWLKKRIKDIIAKPRQESQLELLTYDPDKIRFNYDQNSTLAQTSIIESDYQKIEDYFLTNESCILNILDSLTDPLCMKEKRGYELLGQEFKNLDSYMNGALLRTMNIGFFLPNKDVGEEIWSQLLNPDKPEEKDQIFALFPSSKFSHLFRKNFHVIEPFVVAIYLVSSPFSGYTSLREAIHVGFKKLENYLKSDFVQKTKIYESFASLFQAYSGQDILMFVEDGKREQIYLERLIKGVLVKINRRKQEILCEVEDLKPFANFQRAVANLQKELAKQGSRTGELPTHRVQATIVNQLAVFKSLIPALSEVIEAIHSSLNTLTVLSLEEKLKTLVEEAENLKDSMLFFCFLEEFFDYFCGQSYKVMKSSGDGGSRIPEIPDYYSMLYDKQELFAIPELTSISGFQEKHDETTELFPPVFLNLPIDVKLLRDSFTWNKTKQYYFFLPNVVDLSLWCSPVKDQGSLNACTAFSGIALVEYWHRRNFNRYEELSPLFLYKVARELMQRSGDTGASIQATMQAITLFGIPPEDFWSYQENQFDDDPPSFCYSYAQNYQTVKYFRLDSEDAAFDRQLLLFKVKAALSAGIPCIFGLTLYSSVYNERHTSRGYIPYPSDTDKIVGGHTLVTVGFNDYKVLDGANGTFSPEGAFLVRNSWGTEWGKQGYGWLSYEYLLNGLTSDWWALIKAEMSAARAIRLYSREPGGDPHGSGSGRK